MGNKNEDMPSFEIDGFFDSEEINVDPSLFDPNSVTGEWLKDFAEAFDPEKSGNDVLWEPQEGPQSRAFYSDVDELFYGGAAGGGKMLVYGSKVLTPFGWRLVEDVNLGDQLVAHDGTVTRVIGVYPHTNKPLYKFTFIDGATVTVSDDHLWMYWFANKKTEAERQYALYSPEKGVHTETVRGRMATSEQLYEYHQKQQAKADIGKRPCWIITPLPKPVMFTTASKVKHSPVIKIAPYLMGLLIGDGSLLPNSFSITSTDNEIHDYVKSVAGDDVVVDNDKLLRFRGEFSVELQNSLSHYGLWRHDSSQKFIPAPYLFACIENRIDLMAGLIDTGGYIDKRGHITYTAVSEQLAKDVQHLARSLGCKATITEKETSCRDKDGAKIECQLAYNIYIQGGDITTKFARLPRKQKRTKSFNEGNSKAGRRIVSIEKAGYGDGVCFAIDHPSGLHVVQDFIVTHNSDLMLGLILSSLSPHRKAIIFRRSYPELKDIVTRAQEILANTDARFKAGNQMKFDDLPDSKSLELGSVPNFQAAQKYRGRPHDLKLFDELPDISEQVYTFLIGWARTAEPNVPVRVVAAGNPPSTTEGKWVIRRWSPWLDRNHPNPAQPGEKRWFATLDGEDREITEYISPEGAKGEPFKYTDKKGNVETVKPKSRTFIPAKLDDNRYLAGGEYQAVLQNMPEPYRSQLLYGDFDSAMKEDPWQVIPTEWVMLAERRWKDAEENGVLSQYIRTNPSYGLDVAEAGADKTVLVKLTGIYMQYYDYIEVEDDDIMRQVDLIEVKLAGTKRAPIAVDAIGVGVGVASILKRRGYTVAPVKVSRSTKRRDKTGQFNFLNIRAEIWWRMREALDPFNEHAIALPPDPRLRAELTSAKYERTPNDKIKIEDKRKIKARLGHSPDIAEALMLALYVQRRGAVPLRMA